MASVSTEKEALQVWRALPKDLWGLSSILRWRGGAGLQHRHNHLQQHHHHLQQHHQHFQEHHHHPQEYHHHLQKHHHYQHVTNITTIFKNIKNTQWYQQSTRSPSILSSGYSPKRENRLDSVGIMTMDGLGMVGGRLEQWQLIMLTMLTWWAGTIWNTRKWSVGLEQWKLSRSMLLLVSAWAAPLTPTHLESPQFWTTTIRRLSFSQIDLLSRPRYMPASGSWKIKHSRGRLGGCHHRRHLLLHGKQPPSSNISVFLPLRCWPSSST